jgi:hypothetical protein
VAFAQLQLLDTIVHHMLRPYIEYRP